MNEIEHNEKYANYLRNKIIKYFNLKSEDLELKYIKSILNSKTYDLYSSIYLLNSSFFENNKNTKLTINHVKKFTQDLVNSKNKFTPSNIVENNNNSQKLGEIKNESEIKNKFIHNSIEYIFKKYDDKQYRNKENENDNKITKAINNKKKNSQKNYNQNSENLHFSKAEKIQNKTNLNEKEKEANANSLFDKLHNKHVKNIMFETKTNNDKKKSEHNKSLSKKTEEKEEKKRN